MQRMAELQKSIRDEHYNAEALKEMARQQDMQGGLDDIEKLMREGKTDEALAKLQQLQAADERAAEAPERDAESMGGRASTRSWRSARRVQRRR